MGARTTHLDSGLTVVTEAVPNAPSVTVGFWVGVGARDEPPEQAGVSHFLEHLLFKGTESRTAAAIAEGVDRVGGDMDAFTAKDHTAFEVRVLADCLELALDLLSDMMWAPALGAEEVEAEREVILEELLSHHDDPADAVHDLALEALFPDDALGREILGDEGTLGNISRDDIRRFHARHYRPGAVIVAVAGPLEHEAVAAGVERRFRGRPGGELRRRQPPTTRPRPLTVQTQSTEQAHLVVAMRAPGSHDADRYETAALNHVLGGGLSSRLFQEVRERRGLAYSVYSCHTPYDGAGSLEVYAGTSPRRVAEVLQVVHHELDSLAHDGIGANELEIAKGHLRGSFLLGLEDTSGRAGRIGHSQLVHGEVPEVSDVLARIDALTVADVGRVAEQVLGGARVLAAVGPFAEGDLRPHAER